MRSLTNAPYIQLHVPDTKTEQEFLRFAVEAAVKKYRETHRNIIGPSQAVQEESYALLGHASRGTGDALP